MLGLDDCVAIHEPAADKSNIKPSDKKSEKKDDKDASKPNLIWRATEQQQNRLSWFPVTLLVVADELIE
jgi:hypothetical protein